MSTKFTPPSIIRQHALDTCKKFTFQEVQNLHSVRESSALSAKTLTAAKIEATKKQFFQGTILKIFSGKVLICYKKNGIWKNSPSNDFV